MRTLSRHSHGRAARSFRGGALPALALLAGCAASGPVPGGAARAAPADEPYVLVLGTAQDGGLPQIGCRGPACRAAHADPARRRYVASLLIADPRSGRRWLIDATPDLPEQVELAAGHPPGRPEPAANGPRPPLFEGIFLTHAHGGHYTGLVHLGREAYDAHDLPVLGSRRMIQMLEQNAPWSLMVESGALQPVVLRQGEPYELAPGLTVEALPVPHRDELTDTMAFVVRGPRRSLLYLPDIDKWERWTRGVETVLAGVDVALVDGTFYADGEVPGRDLAEIPHPFIVESLERFGTLPRAERAKLLFTHLNHTNPAADPHGEAARRIRAAGMGVARDGQVMLL